MNVIELMIDEHTQITRMLKVMRSACYGILNGENINYEDFAKMIDFVRHYADAHHHGKEEKFLFKTMEEHLGDVGKKLIRNGMLVEHDLGRLYISGLEEALEAVKSGSEEKKLDVIANAVAYTQLLERHIAKENDVVYTFAQRQLTPELMEMVERQSEVFEKSAAQKGVQDYYLKMVQQLEQKYV